MRTPVVVRTLTFLVAFAIVPCLLRSSEPPQQPEPKPPLSTTQSEPDGRIGSAADASAASNDTLARPLVYLDKAAREGREPRNLARRGILHQELYRQAFLMAAREECGAVTRDARLGDQMPAERENLPFTMASTNLPSKNLKRDEPGFNVQIRRGLPGRQKEPVVELQLEKKPQRENA